VTTGRGKRVTRFGRAIFELPCTIAEGAFQGVELLHYVNLPPRSAEKRGRTRISPRMTLAKDLVVALGRLPEGGRVTAALRALEHKMFRVHVLVPERDSKNRLVPVPLRVPVVSELLGRA